MPGLSNRIQAVQQIVLSKLRPEAQWESIEELLALDPATKRQVLGWLLTNRQGYVEVRARAGAELLANNSAEAWNLVKKLVASADPDDRDTALVLLRQNPSQTNFNLAKPLLSDSYPYIQLSAIDYLKHVYRVEALQALHELEQHHEEWVREAVRQALDRLS